MVIRMLVKEYTPRVVMTEKYLSFLFFVWDPAN